MDVRLGPEVGLHRPAVFTSPEVQVRTENYANLPNRDVNNRLADQTEQSAASPRLSDTFDRYQTEGNIINIQV